MLFLINKNMEIIKSLEIDKENFDFTYIGKNYEWYIKGNLFYLMNEKGMLIIGKEVNNEKLNTLMLSKKFDPQSIKKNLEGHYVCVIRNKKQIIVFGDKFNRRNLFFTQDNQKIYFSTVLSKELVNKSGKDIDEIYLYSFFLIVMSSKEGYLK